MIDKDLGVLANIAQILSVVGPVLMALWTFLRHMEKKQDKQNTESLLMNQRLERIEEQFGPNGGGLREAVNTIGRDIKKIDERTVRIGQEVAELRGRFTQHIEEN